ncbi:MAG: pseudouridine synthase [Candidatus Pacebacteria bacterium]|nr:pseudouridine synthase [Candidatus Paceibacterota bacterium]
MKKHYPIRINRYLALNNYATRKEADELIKKGLVFINERKAVLGDQVKEEDNVTLSKKIPKKEFVYYAYNKPIGISTNKDSSAKDILSKTKFPTKVFPVGRLDKDSYGLIIMTNDGRITDKLLSPKYVHEKEYIVKVEPNISDKFIELIQNGVKFDGITSKKCSARRKSKDTFYITLTEGKKRQIRRMCEALHHKVIDLKRIRIMNIMLEDLSEGNYREIKGEELNTFLKLLNSAKEKPYKK